MTFEEVWDTVAIDTVVTISDGTPPPTTNTQGPAYMGWFSHNFTGTLEEKIERGSWKYMKFEVLPIDTPEAVEYLAYEIVQGPGHTFEVV